MQAATVDQFLVSVLIEEALQSIFKEVFNEEEMAELGFGGATGLKERINTFQQIQASVSKHVESIAKFTDLETETYK